MTDTKDKVRFRDLDEFADEYDDLSQESHESAQLAAIAAGYEVVKRQPNQLLLDLDSGFIDPGILRRLRSEGLVKRRQQWQSKSGNLHTLITLNRDLSPVEALLLQALLGSDPLRELLGLLRVWNDVPEPSVLFKPAGAEIRELP